MGQFDHTQIGLFWEDLPAVKGKRAAFQRGSIPEIPATGWRPPSEFPNLSAAKVIGVDTETFDPELTEAGPGWGRGSGHIIGVSISVEDGSSWYFPVRHGLENGKQVLPEFEAGLNMDPAQVFSFLRSTLADQRPKVGANLIYDIGWLAEENVAVGGRLYDIQFAEALLDSETPSVALDNLGARYLGIGKETSILYDWLASWCGGVANERQRKNLYLSPPSLAGPYAEADASLPIKILGEQWPLMDRRGVLDIFDIECRLIPLLVAMRRKGAPVNVAKAEEIYDRMGGDLERLEKQLTSIAGQPVNPNAAESIQSAFKKIGIPLPTKKHKEKGTEVVSFDAIRLEGVKHPLAGTILEYKQIAKVRNTFVKSYIIDKQVNGRLHCSFHPLKGEGSGARSGRFSSSDPNLQNIPVRTDIGKLVRGIFEAETGRWVKADYSQIEYRLLAHHAVGGGAEELRRDYQADPDIDYHNKIAELVYKMTGIELPRRNVKNINFGLIYGLSQNNLAANLGLKKKEGADLFENYHTAAPFVRATMEDCANEVHRTGSVMTLMGRKSDFKMWGPKKYVGGRPFAPYEQACQRWGPYNIERSFTHKAVNRKLQGGAADVMKKAMVDAYEAGIFAEDACGIPLLTVHDELDFEDKNDPNGPWWDEFRRIMEGCIPHVRVPIRIDISSGSSWGSADK